MENELNKFVVDTQGNKSWYNEQGQLHRENGPAMECADGGEDYWINGKLHREDGPAMIYKQGKSYWFINNERIE